MTPTDLRSWRVYQSLNQTDLANDEVEAFLADFAVQIETRQ